MEARCPLCGEPLHRLIEQHTLTDVLLMGDCRNPDCQHGRRGSTVEYATRPMTDDEKRAALEVVAGLFHSSR